MSPRPLHLSAEGAGERATRVLGVRQRCGHTFTVAAYSLGRCRIPGGSVGCLSSTSEAVAHRLLPPSQARRCCLFGTEEVRRVLLWEAPCSPKVPGKPAAKRSDGICCIIWRPPFLVSVASGSVPGRSTRPRSDRKTLRAAKRRGKRLVKFCGEPVEKIALTIQCGDESFNNWCARIKENPGQSRNTHRERSCRVSRSRTNRSVFAARPRFPPHGRRSPGSPP
jgi:hypothetical protein